MVQRQQFAFVRSQNVLDYAFDTKDIRYVSHAHARALKGVHLQSGDLLLNITGDGVTFGRCCIIPDSILPAAVNQHVAIIRVDPSICRPGYLLAYLCHPRVKEYIGSFNAGGSRRAITKGHIESFLIALPPLEVQKEIERTLNLLLGKIALNREQNRTMERIAHAIFRAWFVDFLPIRAKIAARAEGGEPIRAAMCAISGKRGHEIDDLSDESHKRLEVMAKQFSDDFVNSDAGEIPRSWQVIPLGNLTTYLSRGVSPKYTDGAGILVLNQRCIRENVIDITKARRHDVTARSISGRELCVGDVLVNSTGIGTLGRVAQVMDMHEPTIVDSHVTVVRSGPAVTWNYLGLELARRQDEIEQLGEGSTGQTELSRAKLAGLMIIAPPREILSHFDALTVPLRQRISTNLRENQTLAEIRDTLLPRLISGQISLEHVV
ncbi:MAG TPA: restriction endonuclease subunit S [Longimicrobium sp.]